MTTPFISTSTSYEEFTFSTSNLYATIDPELKEQAEIIAKKAGFTKIVFVIKEAIAEVDPILASKMVPECLYRGFCPEFMNPCGYSKTERYQKDLKKYREEWVD